MYFLQGQMFLYVFIVFQAVLSGSNCVQPARTGAAGFATMTVNSDNTVNYKISLVGLSSKVTSISVFGNTKRRRKRLVADVISQYKDGKAEGKLGNLNGKGLHLLMSNRFKVCVTTEQSNSGELSGQVNSFPFEGYLARHNGFPVPLAGKFVHPPVYTGAAGHAWIELTKECQFHYEIVVSGLSKDDDASLTAHLHGLAEISGTEISHKQLLKGFYGTEACGSVQEMPAEIYEHLNRGTAFVQVSTKRYPFGEIRGQVRLTNDCSSLFSQDESSIKAKDLSVFNQPATGLRLTKPDRKSHTTSLSSVLTNTFELDPSSCYSDGRWMEEGSKWAAPYDRKCTICHCQSGSVLCDPVFCPPLTCDRPLAISTECCPVCNDGLGIFEAKKDGDVSIGSSIGFLRSNINKEKNGKSKKEGCYHESDSQYHAFGSWWHPVFPQFGMMPCANCTCHSNGKIFCGKIVCPRLTCKNPVKENPTDCCKSCKAAPDPLQFYQKDNLRPQEDSRGRMCVFGANLYAPGETWRLNIPALGKLDCIECSCASHGVESKCVRKCPPIEKDCGKVERRVKSCCPWKCSSRTPAPNDDFVSP